MFERVRIWVLRAVKLPHDPEPPAGAPGSLQVFRAGRNLYKMRLLRWGIGQIGALVGIIFSLYFLEKLERGVEDVRYDARRAAVKEAATRKAAANAKAPAVPAEKTEPKVESKTEATASVAAPAPATEPPKAAPATGKAKVRKGQSNVALRRLVDKTPRWIFPALTFLELAGIAAYFVQIPLTLAMVRLDYELRWYIVTDRSLRIRAGLTSVQETTMSFANVQQVVVTQGPLQRLLGIADVRVQSAGGGGDHHEAQAGESLHTGVFHGVDNAHQIRDLILERLRQFRETGLGDPDEPVSTVAVSAAPGSEAAPAATAGTTLAAAQELLAEARALRQALS